MDDRQRQLLFLRFAEIEAELQALAEGRVVDGDPATVEADLLQEQDEIEFTLGDDYFERRDGGIGDWAIRRRSTPWNYRRH